MSGTNEPDLTREPEFDPDFDPTEALEDAREAREAAEDEEFDTAIKAFCNRKYESDFSKEMTRSAEVYLEDFK